MLQRSLSTSIVLTAALCLCLSHDIRAQVAESEGNTNTSSESSEKIDADLIFNQSLLLALILGIATLIFGYAWSGHYMGTVAADHDTAQAGITYLYWYMPGMAMQFALVAMGSALRGTGIVKPTMIVQMLTVVLNIILAPVLIAGWGTGHPLGVAGAGLASTLAIAAGVVLLWLYFSRLEKYVAVDRALWRPQLPVWKRMLGIGFPAGGEFLLMFVFMAVISYPLLRREFGRRLTFPAG